MKLNTLVEDQRPWGILGDGQLARMLALAAAPLGISVKILSTSKNSSAAQVSSADPLLLNKDDLERCAGLIFESEFVDCDHLESLTAMSIFRPSLSVIRTLQNKLFQKKLLHHLSVPTSPFAELTKANWKETIRETSTGKVLKFATMGYDGKGVFIQREGESLEDFISRAQTFCEDAAGRGISLFVEDKVPYLKEVAMIAAQSETGEFVNWPLVISEQQHGICNRAYGPATSFGVHQATEAEAKKYLKSLGDHLGIVGVYAMEFFLCQDGQLLVNEIAPRVHNTGHYTQNASLTSQFENHWRAVLGLPLGETDCSPFFAMQNLLCPDVLPQPDVKISPPMVDRRTHLHWYGKKGVSRGRKLGHMNVASFQNHESEKMLSALEGLRAAWDAKARKEHT